MGILTQALGLILCLSILVVVHEFGHYFFARLFKVRVDKFYLFFDWKFAIFKFKKGDTEWGIGWIPFGGYCKIAGMIDESMDKEQLKQEPQPYEFRSKPTWQRFFIIFGGVFFNFILAILIYISLSYKNGETYLPLHNAKYGYAFDSLLLKNGFKNGDKLISINDKNPKTYTDFVPTMIFEKSAVVTIERQGVKQTITMDEDFLSNLLKKKSRKSLIFPIIPAIIDSIIPTMPASKTELKKGDMIIKINKIDVQDVLSSQKAINSKPNSSVSIVVLRGSDTISILTNVNEKGMIGISFPDIFKIFKLEKTEYSLLGSIPAGFNYAVETVINYLQQLKLIFTHKEAASSIGGFGTIGSLFPKSWDWTIFWKMTAFISLMLAVMNLLPIPALDGGYIIMIIYEMVTRRKPSEKFMEYAVTVGFFLLLALLVFANFNDIYRFFIK